MTHVLVVGGGVAGIAAAMAASRSGADVTIAEASDRLPPNKSLFPYLLSKKCSKEDLYRLSGAIDGVHDGEEQEEGQGGGGRRGRAGLSTHAGVTVRLSQKIQSIKVDENTRAVQSERGLELFFDSLIVATGSQYAQDQQPRGLSKVGAYLMKDAEDYLSLSRSVGDLAHVVLIGPSPVTLVSASELSPFVKTTVFLGPTGLRRFSPGIGRRVVEAARSRGVALVEAGVESVVGVERVEAVVSEGSVLACDAAVVFPLARPTAPPVDCLRGPHGGLLVDESMRTSSRNIFAAGECAELRLGAGSFPFRLHSSARAMGETAGTNAAGGSVKGAISGTVALDIFGTEVCTAGLPVRDARSLGLDLVEVESDERVRDDPFGKETMCVSIAFERKTQSVYGLQAAGAGALSLASYISAVVAGRVKLRELVLLESAYLPPHNRDVSPICLTAAKAVARPGSDH